MSRNTTQSFRDKWIHNRGLAFEETLDPNSEIHRWILTRNGFADEEELKSFLITRPRILDAGCGNGRVTALLARSAQPTASLVACDLVAADVARDNLAGLPNVRVLEADLLGDLSPLGEFDFIYCQEVLHHTAAPRTAFLNLVSRLAPNGEIAVYVYRVKGPAREFTDDFIRERIANLPYDEAMAVCRQIAEFGRVLSAVPGTIRVPRIDVLGIEAGEYSVQRLIYHFFMKCFWNDRLNVEDNAAINFDWYHPQDASRHRVNEVREWFDAGALAVVHEHVDHYGITIRGRRVV